MKTVGIRTTKSTVHLFGMKLDALRMPDAVGQLLDWVQNRDGNCHYVVTPNVDHAVMFQKHVGLQRAYADASLVLADGFPVLAAAKLLHRPIPERVPGSDLVPALFETVDAEARAYVLDPSPLRVFLLGAAPGVAERAAQNIEQQWPAVTVVGTYSPPLGFEKNPTENAAILRHIAQARPDVLIIGLGAPKQELWVHAHRSQIAAPVALCVGATIDFLAGEKPRAPAWMRRVGLEWLHRLLGEPRRLAKRYLRDAWIFPQLVWREWAAGRRAVSFDPLKSTLHRVETAEVPEFVDQAGLWDIANSR
ncbi:MAG TPA: WecB/TagA/CpsF family glycosyltransferase [Pirellulales bacterium]|nr:WecB/TagA/CpsF family glycosyltransferase [Pirellulales bacterium]